MFGLPKTADVVRTDLVGLSFNQIEICWLCNFSKSLAGKAFFSHEKQNKTTIFDFFYGYKFFTRSQSNSSLDTFDELLRIWLSEFGISSVSRLQRIEKKLLEYNDILSAGGPPKVTSFFSMLIKSWFGILNQRLHTTASEDDFKPKPWSLNFKKFHLHCCRSKKANSACMRGGKAKRKATRVWGGR